MSLCTAPPSPPPLSQTLVTTNGTLSPAPRPKQHTTFPATPALTSALQLHRIAAELAPCKGRAVLHRQHPLLQVVCHTVK